MAPSRKRCTLLRGCTITDSDEKVIKLKKFGKLGNFSHLPTSPGWVLVRTWAWAPPLTPTANYRCFRPKMTGRDGDGQYGPCTEGDVQNDSGHWKCDTRWHGWPHLRGVSQDVYFWATWASCETPLKLADCYRLYAKWYDSVPATRGLF